MAATPLTNKNDEKTIMQKSPKSVKSMDPEGGFNPSIGSILAELNESSSNQAFRDSDTDTFDSEKAQERGARALNSKERGPKYRLTQHYVKSIGQYKKERLRRKQIWALSSEGLTQKQISEKLGVSEKTVQRGLKRVSQYYLGRLRRTYEVSERARMQELCAEIEAMTFAERFVFIAKLLKERKKITEVREYLRHHIHLIIDLDHLLPNGLPSCSLWPKAPINIDTSQPWNIRVFCAKNGEKYDISNLTLRRT